MCVCVFFHVLNHTSCCAVACPYDDDGKVNGKGTRGPREIAQTIIVFNRAGQRRVQTSSGGGGFSRNVERFIARGRGEKK